MARNIYTLQHYKFIIGDKEVWDFQVKAYQIGRNWKKYFGASYYAYVEPCIEEFFISRAEAQRARERLKKYMLETGRENWTFRKHGVTNDYTWEKGDYGAYIGTPKEAPLQVG